MPAAFLLFALRRPVVGALLEHGDYTAEAAVNASRALGGFALGLVGFSVYLFVLRGFYAHQDTRTPFVINLVQNGLNIVLAFLLVGRYGILGLGVALAVSYVVCALWALQVLSYKVPGFPAREVLVRAWPMLVAAVLAGEAAWIVNRWIGGDTGAEAVLGVTVGGLVGLAVYVGGLIAMRVPEIDAARSMVGRLTGRSRPSAATPE
jgi:putative peptidoglycan lipid II flippase